MNGVRLVIRTVWAAVIGAMTRPDIYVHGWRERTPEEKRDPRERDHL